MRRLSVQILALNIAISAATIDTPKKSEENSEKKVSSAKQKKKTGPFTN